MEDKKPVCGKCNTPLVPAKKELKLDGTLKMDGTWNYANMVCPHCHPELATTEK